MSLQPLQCTPPPRGTRHPDPGPAHGRLWLFSTAIIIFTLRRGFPKRVRRQGNASVVGPVAPFAALMQSSKEYLETYGVEVRACAPRCLAPLDEQDPRLLVFFFCSLVLRTSPMFDFGARFR